MAARAFSNQEVKEVSQPERFWSIQGENQHSGRKVLSLSCVT